jgi:hypothetical protein
MQYLDDELDVNAQKIQQLERELESTRIIVQSTIESLKETQRYLMKLAYNQSEITKRVSQWPYLAVDSNKADDDI